MLPTNVQARQDLGRKGLSYMLVLTPCCPNKPLLRGYLRISKQDETKDQRGLDRQLQDALDAAHANGCCLSHAYVDDDLTAAKEDVIRPAFERILIDLESGGKGSGISMYHQDRLYRLIWDFERIRRIHRTVTALRFVTLEKKFDLSDTTDVIVLRVHAIMGENEVEETSRRLKRKAAGSASLGLRTGGPRAFGYNATPESYHRLGLILEDIRERSVEAFNWLEAGKMRYARSIAEDTPRLGLLGLLEDYNAAYEQVKRERRALKCPLEAALLLGERENLLEGVGPNTIVRNWWDAGIRGTRGGQVDRTGFLAMISSPLLAGYRMHQGRVQLDREGNKVKGTQELIFTDDQHEEIVDYLLRRGYKVFGRDREYDASISIQKLPHGNQKGMLALLLICGICYTPMYLNEQEKKRTSKRTGEVTTYVARDYVCGDRLTCPRVSVSAKHAERAVLELVGNYIASRPAPRTTASSRKELAWGKQGELDALDEARTFWSNKIKEAGTDKEHAFDQIQILGAQIKSLLTEKRQWREETRASRPRETRQINPARFTKAKEPDRQRAILDQYLEAVLVLPVTKRAGPFFDPDRLVPRWRKRTESGTSPQAAPA